MGGEPGLQQLLLEEGNMVIGVEPSWLIREGNYTEHYYNLMSDLVVGEYDLNPSTGYPRSSDNKNVHLNFKIEDSSLGEVNILQKAIGENPEIRLLLLVSSYGDYEVGARGKDKYQKFFRANSKAQKVFMDSLRTTLRVWVETYEIPANQIGVMLDFQNLPDWPNRARDMRAFIKKLKATISLEEETGLVYFRLTPKTPQDKYTVKGLIEHIRNSVDLFILKGYGYEKPNELSSTTPVLTENHPNNIAVAVNHYVDDLKIDKDKLIVEFPYFNTVYHQQSPQIYKQNTQFEPYYSYQKLHQLMEESQANQETTDPLNIEYQDSSYAIFTDASLSKYVYEDSLTLSYKYEWIKRNRLAGIGIWGMGYNQTADARDKLWWPVADKFSRRPPETGWLGASLIFLLMFGGLPYSIYSYWEVRNVLDKYKKYLLNITGISIFFLALSIICINPTLRGQAGALIGGAILGFFALTILIRKYIGKLKKYLRYVGIKI